MIEIRDPVHGPIALSEPERRVIDCAAYQRLRHVKQLGFGEMTFPGATHTRYLHGLGAMHVAGRAFDVATARAGLPAREASRLRQTVRLAALLHDVGHPPLSHTAEALLPAMEALPAPVARGRSGGHASHEDMTLHQVLHGELGDRVDEELGGGGIARAHVAGLVDLHLELDAGAFVVDGVDWRPLLGQLVSSELDVDRMDYLLRDSLFSGVPYGRYDLDWLVGGLDHHVADGRAHLALRERALLSFEDFLLSRLHMFVMVYFHPRTNVYDRMLLLFLKSLGEAARFPSDPAAYAACDDTLVWSLLRQNANDPWAARVLQRALPLKRVVDLDEAAAASHRAALDEALRSLGMSPQWITSKGMLSKGGGGAGKPPIWVHRDDNLSGPRTVRLEEATALFQRYAEPTVLVRLYVEPEHREEARATAAKLLRSGAE